MAMSGTVKLLLVIIAVVYLSFPIGSSGNIKYRASSTVCNSSLGIENGNIRDTQMLTHFVQPGYEPWKGRLNGNGAWWVPDITPIKYLQINFGTERHVTGIQTQGFEDGWVETFQVETASTPNDFLGNTDNDTVVQNDFNLVLTTRYIRVVVKTYHVTCKMRIELLGCDDKATTAEIPTTAPVPTTTPVTTASQLTGPSTTASTTNQVPTDSITNQVPTDSTTNQVPTDSTTNQVPTDSTTNQVPTDSTTNQVPTDSTTNQVPTDSITNQVPTRTTDKESATVLSTTKTDVPTTKNLPTTTPGTTPNVAATGRQTTATWERFTDHVFTLKSATENSTTGSSNNTHVSQPAESGAQIGAIVGGTCAGVVVMTSLVTTSMILRKRAKQKIRVIPLTTFE
ncbi:hypothetical protein Bbelb_358420 [Branchiostoma belcheri]|nr:hypothetical protein Bbelb_358420 [Branchiostoma belcheri]